MIPWPFSRNKNMTEPNVMGFLCNPVRAGENDAAESSTLQDFGFWNMEAWKPTAIAQALMEGTVRWSECALLQISKRPAAKNDTEIKPLVLISKVLIALHKNGVDELWARDCQDYLYGVVRYASITEDLIAAICKAHENNVCDKRKLSGDYIDIWINALCESNLFVKTRHGIAIAHDPDCYSMVAYIAKFGDLISKTPVKVGATKKDFYEYMANLNTGLMEILPPAFITKQVPSLLKLSSKKLQAQTVQPSSNADGLTIALKTFQRNRGGLESGSGSEIPLRDEFIQWCVDVDGKKEITPKTYLPPLESVSMPMEVESMKSSWNGVYEFVYGKKPTKHVLEIATAAELDAVYGDLLKVYATKDSPMPEGVSAANWNKVRAWVKADKAKGSASVILHESAFKKYRQFLAWREANGGSAKGGPNGWASYDAWAKAARETFAKVDAGMLIAADFDYMDFARKFVYNPTVANVFFKDHEENEKSEVGNFISQNRQTPKAASWYLEKDNLPKVKGFGVGCALNFMMKVRPAEFATYSPMIDKALMSVGLLAKPLPPEPTVESYEQCKALQGQVLAKMHELKVGKAADDDSPADYLTVNEFAWWLSDEKNQNLIKEKVMSAQLKPVDSKKTVIKGNRALSDAFKDDEMLKRLAAALRTKPFAILAGHSGTGKSQLVRRLAYMTCNNQKLVDEGKDKTAPGNYCMVQVKPNWHDSTDLLGYYSDLGTRHFVNTAFVQFLCKAYAYPETPFFLCLDEMNLAPVEQYFAEYLSAVESLEKKGGDWVSDSLIEIVKTGEKDENGNAKVDEEILGQIIAGAQSTEAADWIRKHGLTIPKNLFVVGTVNMDETTCQFSRKVLDRAMTLLMNEVKFAEMCKAVDPSKEQLLDDAGVAFFMQGSRRGHVDTVEAGLLDNLNKPLANTPFVVAYRFANEYALYEEALANLNGVPQLDEGEADEAKIAEHWKKVSEHAVDALDHVVLMKLLPRIHGMKDVVKGIFEGRKIAEKDTPGLKDEVKADGLSAGIMTEILSRGDEYLTFWP